MWKSKNSHFPTLYVFTKMSESFSLLSLADCSPLAEMKPDQNLFFQLDFSLASVLCNSNRWARKCFPTYLRWINSRLPLAFSATLGLGDVFLREEHKCWNVFRSDLRSVVSLLEQTSTNLPDSDWPQGASFYLCFVIIIKCRLISVEEFLLPF